MKFKTSFAAAAAVFALASHAANAQNYLPSPAATTATWLKANVFSDAAMMAAAKGPGPVWKGLVTFKTVSSKCRPAASSFSVGAKRMAFVRLFPSGAVTPAMSIVFPDGAFLGVPRTTTQYGTIAITKIAWLYSSPTNTNAFSLKTVPSTVSKSTAKFTADATLTYFYAIAGCTVTVHGVFQQVK
jgi:hypothetical protein